MIEKFPSKKNYKEKHKSDNSLKENYELELLEEWKEKGNLSARNRIIEKNINSLKTFVSRNFAYWTNKNNIDLNDLYGEAYEAFILALNNWKGEKNGDFSSYWREVVKRRLNTFIGQQKADMLTEKERRALWKIPEFSREIGKDVKYWTEEDIKAFGEKYSLSGGVIRTAVDQFKAGLKKLELDAPIGTEEGASWHEHINGKQNHNDIEESSLLSHGSAPYYFSPESILSQEEKENYEPQNESAVFDMEKSLDKFRDWLNLLTEKERLIIKYKYILPSVQAKRHGSVINEYSYESIASMLSNTLKEEITPEEVEELDKRAREKLEKFSKGDFSVVDLKEKENYETSKLLQLLQEKAGKKWSLWIHLLPNLERRVLLRRWFYNHKNPGSQRQTPRNFDLICQKKNKKTNNFSINISMEEAKELEKKALDRLKKFSEGDFSQAYYKKVSYVIAEENKELAKKFLTQFPKGSLEYSVFLYRFISKNKIRFTKSNGKTYIGTAPMLSAGSNRFRKILTKITGDEKWLTDKEGSKERIKKTEEELAKKFFLFALKHDISFENFKIT